MTGWLPDGVIEWGGRAVARSAASAVPRGRASLTGTVRRVRRSSVPPCFEAVLDDGTGQLLLRWMGREWVPGVVDGRRLSAEGTVLADRGRLVVLNPLYRLEP